MEHFSPFPFVPKSGAQVGIGDRRLMQNSPVQAIESKSYPIGLSSASTNQASHPIEEVSCMVFHSVAEIR